MLRFFFFFCRDTRESDRNELVASDGRDLGKQLFHGEGTVRRQLAIHLADGEEACNGFVCVFVCVAAFALNTTVARDRR